MKEAGTLDEEDNDDEEDIEYVKWLREFQLKSKKEPMWDCRSSEKEYRKLYEEVVGSRSTKWKR